MSSFDAYGEETNVNSIYDRYNNIFTGGSFGSGAYSSFPAVAGDFSRGFPAEGDVAVDHASASPEIEEEGSGDHRFDVTLTVSGSPESTRRGKLSKALDPRIRYL